MGDRRVYECWVIGGISKVSQEQKSAAVSDDESDRAGIGSAATSLGARRSTLNVGLYSTNERMPL